MAVILQALDKVPNREKMKGAKDPPVCVRAINKRARNRIWKNP